MSLPQFILCQVQVWYSAKCMLSLKDVLSELSRLTNTYGKLYVYNTTEVSISHNFQDISENSILTFDLDLGSRSWHQMKAHI